jgi:two-component system sensor histidine kinase YesM
MEKKNFFLKLKEKAMSLKISTKFVLFYFALLVVSILLSSSLYQRINSNILGNKIGDAAIQTLDTISTSIDSLFENVNNYSKMILSNEYLQNTLLQKNDTLDSVKAAKTIGASLAGYMEAMPDISSIYVFDNNGNAYFADRASFNRRYSSIEKADWYDEVLSRKGRYIIKIDSGGILAGKTEEKYISFIRVINDLQRNQPIGTLIIDIPADALKATYRKAISESNTDIAIFENSTAVVGFENPALNEVVVSNVRDVQDSKATIGKIGEVPYLLSTVVSEKTKWRLVSVIPFDEVMSESGKYDFITFFIILLNSVLLFIGAILISRLITSPIKKLIESMKKAEKGEFCKVEIASGNDEIGMLRDGYNVMVSEIRNLIEKMLLEQKIKRKAELSALQEQIKPHFLYNSLDVIAYMSMMGKGDDAYNLIIALSNYYRGCLSKGSEVITIMEEVDIVRNYLAIQKARFPGLFEDEYEVDEGVGEVRIVKLILQPLVENALYHGIRPKGETGRIIVKAVRNGGDITLSVEDDGVGMNEEELHKVIGSELEANASSFGLRGTIERLKIYYGNEDIYEISSEKGKGTRIVITIPGEQVNAYGS